MHLFIANGIPERRQRLEKHLKERGISDTFTIVWNTEWDKNHPFVRWIKICVAPHWSPELISVHVKAFENLQTAINLKQMYFMTADDDVVFPKNFVDAVNKIQLKPFNVVSMGINYHIPYGENLTFTGNVGGMECCILSSEFSQFLLDNVDFNQTLDIVISAIMPRMGMKLEITPLAHQTSVLEYRKTTHEGGKFEKNWIDYVNTYKPSGLKYSLLKEEFQKFMNKKNAVERQYKELFDTEIDIWNVDYIEKQYNLIV